MLRPQPPQARTDALLGGALSQDSPHLHTAAMYIKGLAATPGAAVDLVIFGMMIDSMHKEELNEIIPHFRCQQIRQGENRGRFKITMMIHPLAEHPVHNKNILMRTCIAMDAAVIENEKGAAAAPPFFMGADQIREIKAKMEEKEIDTGLIAELRKAIMKQMAAHGDTATKGQPPKTDMERIVQETLTRMQKRNGDV